jgi:hypothetical protein
MGNTREIQVGFKLNGTEGVRQTPLAASDYAGVRKDVDYSYENLRYEREADTGNMSRLADLTGPRRLRVSWTEEAAGGSVSAAPGWHDKIRACGFKSTTLKVMTLAAAPTNLAEVKFGQTIGNNATQGSATITGRVVAVIPGGGGPDKIVYLPVTGSFIDTTTVFNYSDTQFDGAVSGAPANAGYALELQSESGDTRTPDATILVHDVGQIHEAVGARGKVTITMRHGQPLLFNFEFMGPARLPDDAPDTGAAVTGIPAVAAPPVIGGAGFPFLYGGDGGLAAFATDFGINIDNTLAPRPTIGANDVESSGYGAERISDRQITMSNDPEHPAAATLDFYEKMVTGEVLEVRGEVGYRGSTSGWIIVAAPYAQIRNVTRGDRDRLRISTLDMIATGTADDELAIYHVFV